MIREEKLLEDILSNISGLVKNLRKEEDLEAFLLYGSATRGNLKPLSDLDFAILLNNKFIEKKHSEENWITACSLQITWELMNST